MRTACRKCLFLKKNILFKFFYLHVEKQILGAGKEQQKGHELTDFSPACSTIFLTLNMIVYRIIYLLSYIVVHFLA